MNYNRNILVLFVFIVPIFCIISCIPFSEQDLGNGYYYLPEYEAIDIGYPYGSTIYKSDKVLCFHRDNILISGGIIEVDHNDSYILVGQNKSQADDEFDGDVNYFWIVVKMSSDIFGPLSFEQYLEKKKELGVPERLRLKYEKEKR